MADDEVWKALNFAAANVSYESFKNIADSGGDIHHKTNDGVNYLHTAALCGSLNLCKILVHRHNFSVDMADDDGWTAFHFAAKNGSYELIRYFVDMGSNLLRKTNDGRNCLHIAALYGHLNLCKRLKDEHYFDVYAADNDGWTALHYSTRGGTYSSIIYFVDIGTDIFLKTNDGKNCLHIAALYGHLNLCKRLKDEHCFDVYAADNDGWTALHYSTRGGTYSLITYFVDIGTDIYLKTNDGKNCLHIAALNGHLNLCKIFVHRHSFSVDMADDDGWAAFHFAAKDGSYELIRYFVDMGSNLLLKTNDGKNCLHIAALYGHLNLCKRLKDEHYFDVYAADNDGWTALHYSTRGGTYSLITYFVDIGTDIFLKTNDGKNCLHIAALYGHLNLCKRLKDEHYFDVYAADNDGWTALHYSTRGGTYSLITYFVDIGTDIHLKTNDGKNCLHIAALNGHLNLCKILVHRHNFSVDVADDDGWTAFHFVARNGSYELIRYFVDMGNNLLLKTNDGKNCLHIAALYGHLNLCKRLKDEHDFDVCAADNDGWTALHYSTRGGTYSLITYFVDMGTDIYLKTNDGKNCLHIAALYGHLNLCKALENRYNFDIHAADNDGWTAVHFSVRNGSYQLVKYFTNMETDINLQANEKENSLLIEEFNDPKFDLYMAHNDALNLKSDIPMAYNDGWEALYISTRKDNNKLVKDFANMRSDIHRQTNDGKNCLHIAALYGHLNLCKRLIYQYKVDVRMTDNFGWTVLHFSVRNGSPELIAFVAAFTDFKLKTNDGMNCLHIAALHGHLNLCITLIDKYNLDIFMTDNGGWAVIHFCARNGSCELVNYFTALGADIHLKTHDAKNCLHIAARYGHLNLCKTLVNNDNFDVHLIDDDECTALHYSAENGSFDLFSFILGKGSEIYSKTKTRRNVLHFSASNGHYNISRYILEYFVKDYKDNNTKNQYALNGRSYRSQIFYKYDIIFLHAMDTDGNTYLHLAAEGNQAKVCQLLLEYDTEVLTLLNKNDDTARDIARFNGHIDVLNTLKAEYDRRGMLFCFTEKNHF